MRRAWLQPQHRNTVLLVVNNVLGAATGLLFWLILARVANLDARAIGTGMAVVSLGTAVGLVSLAGFDAALIRHVPHASTRAARRALGYSFAWGAAAALAWTIIIGGVDRWVPQVPDLHVAAWAVVAAIGILLVATWLQDAFYMAYGDAAATLRRNIAFAAARVILPVPIVMLAWFQPVATAWALSLLVSMFVGIWFVVRRPVTTGGDVPRRPFLRSARRNITGNAAQFLPGLLLVPIVLAMAGEAAAGFFGMAWTAASLLFLAAAAISRSALSEMVRHTDTSRAVMQRAAVQVAAMVLPATAAGIVLARPVMWIFGQEYMQHAAPAFAILCASAVFVAPVYLYLAVLRAREDRPRTLTLLPLALIVLLLTIAPMATEAWGVQGAAIAWTAANAPFGVYAGIRLWREWARAAEEEVHDGTQTVRGRPHIE